jgi:hypothetical protein
MSGLAVAGPEQEVAAHRPLRGYSLEMVVGVVGGLVAIATGPARTGRG